MPKYTKEEKDSARAYLAPLLRPGTEVRTVVRHVTSSGMARWISVMIVNEGEIRDISWHAARLLGWPVNNRNHEGIEVGGCGMDMGFHLVYSLSSVMFPDGFDCISHLRGPVTQLQRCSHCLALDDSWRASRACDLSQPGLAHDWQPSGDPYRRIGKERRNAPHCPANDHVNSGVNAPFHHHDGGYALRQRWL